MGSVCSIVPDLNSWRLPQSNTNFSRSSGTIGCVHHVDFNLMNRLFRQRSFSVDFFRIKERILIYQSWRALRDIKNPEQARHPFQKRLLLLIFALTLQNCLVAASPFIRPMKCSSLSNNT